MTEATPVLVPLLNPNEPEAVVVALEVSSGQQVAEGDVLALLETTKSVEELVAEGDGFVVGLTAREGTTVQAGELLCYLAPSSDWMPPPAPEPAGSSQEQGIPEGLRITEPALALVREHGIDPARLPIGPLVTGQTLRALLGEQGLPTTSADAPPPAASPFDATAIIVYGGGGHGKSLIDLIRALGVYRLVGVVDDGLAPGELVAGVAVRGGASELETLRKEGVALALNAVGGIGSPASRAAVFERLVDAGFSCPAVVHPRGFVEPSASLAPGAQVFAHAYVGSEARVGRGGIVNTGAVVSHDCVVEDHANIAPGALLAGRVRVQAGALIGMGVAVNLGVVIGAGARVGNNATVNTDVPASGLVRAGTVWAS